MTKIDSVSAANKLDTEHILLRFESFSLNSNLIWLFIYSVSVTKSDLIFNSYVLYLSNFNPSYLISTFDSYTF